MVMLIKEGIVVLVAGAMFIMGGLNINNAYNNVNHQQQVQTLTLHGDTYKGTLMLNGKKTPVKIKPKGNGIEIITEKKGNNVTIIISRDTTKEISSEDKEQIENIFKIITNVNKKTKPKTYLEEKCIKGIEKIIKVVKKQISKSVKKTTKRLFT